MRLHHGRRGRRGNYSATELDEWAREIAPGARDAEVYAYFNNDWEGFAVRNALGLAGASGRVRPRPESTLGGLAVLLILAIILLIIAIAGGVIVHPILFALAIVALVLFFSGRRGAAYYLTKAGSTARNRRERPAHLCAGPLAHRQAQLERGRDREGPFDARP